MDGVSRNLFLFLTQRKRDASMANNYDSSGLDLVEILGEFIGDEMAGDEFSGDESGADALIGALMGNRRPPARRGGYAAQRPNPAAARAALVKKAMTTAIAERRAQAGALLHDRTPTKSREYPLGFASALPVPAGGSTRITTRPQVPFRLDRLTVPSDIAGLFTIDDVKVGKNSQFAAEGAVPARIFQENAVGVCLKGDTAQISMDVTISVTNISGAAATFRAAVIGPAVE